jgi:hypothetical protein
MIKGVGLLEQRETPQEKAVGRKRGKAETIRSRACAALPPRVTDVCAPPRRVGASETLQPPPPKA